MLNQTTTDTATTLDVTTMTKPQRIRAMFALAKKHLLHKNTVQMISAHNAYDSALKAKFIGKYQSVSLWLITSLRYSVGVNHPDYKIADMLSLR